MAEKKARREYGDGSIYRRKSDGRHVGSFYVNGERKYVYGETRKEAKQKLEIAQQQASAGTLIASNKQTVAAYLAHWLSVHKLKVEDITCVNYASYIHAHIVPVLGGIALQKLTTAHIQRFIAQLDADGFAASSIRKFYIVLEMALNDAVKWKLLATNPCQGVTLLRLQQREMQVFTVSEVQHLLDFVHGDENEALITLAVTTGMRQGELLGLKWGDIDLQAMRLQVKRTLIYVSGVGFQETDPKTKSSRRGVTLTHVAIDALKAHRVREAERQLKANRWEHPELVFTGYQGKYLYSGTVDARFKRLLLRAGLPVLRFHDLRHTCATILLLLGTHPKVVQELLGHSSVKVTMDLYSHVLPSMHNETMTGLNAILTTRTLKKEAKS